MYICIGKQSAEMKNNCPSAHFSFELKLYSNFALLHFSGHPTGDDFWAEDVPADVAPADVDTGNPWNSAPVSAPVEEKAAVVAPEPVAWAEFNDAEMVPVSESAEAMVISHYNNVQRSRGRLAQREDDHFVKCFFSGPVVCFPARGKLNVR